MEGNKEEVINFLFEFLNFPKTSPKSFKMIGEYNSELYFFVDIN